MARLAQTLILTFALGCQAAAAWDDTTLSAPVMVDGLIIPYPEFAIFVMPGARISVGFVDAGGGATLRFGGKDLPAGTAEVVAPKQHGLQALEIRNSASGETCRINVFTMIPASRVGKDGRLNGYRIDSYPREPLRGIDIYRPPPGFVEVSAENAGTALSPNFTLGQFVSKQAADYPKYIVLRPALMLKLESILAALNQAGQPTPGFVVMSGFRTPFYNRSIGNVQYSRHVWGGAADIYIDAAPADGRMDDLNKDGRVNRDDARWLANFINDMSRKGIFGPLVGGVGVYGSTAAHGPFVHVDVRGSIARW